MIYKTIITIILATAVSLITGCSSERRVQEGDTVKVHYVGSFNDGTVFDSSRDRNEPFEVTIGSGNAIEGFESGIVGMAIGETKTIQILPEDAYGEWKEDRVAALPRSQFPPDIDIKAGQEFEQKTADGRMMRVKVMRVENDTIFVDANHPMAGKTLNFDIELVEFIE